MDEFDEGGISDYDNEAGTAIRLLDDGDEGGMLGDDDEGGTVVYEDESGAVILTVPEGVDEALSEAGAKVKGARRRRVVKGKGGKKKPGRDSPQWRANVSKALKALRGALKRIASNQLAMQKALPKGSEVASPGDLKGCRIILGNTLALAAPAAAGMAAWGPLAITPAAGMRMSWLCIEVYEDTYAAVAAGNTLIPGVAAFDITAVTVAGSNIIRSNQTFAPGGMFRPTQNRLGFPLATGRDVDISGGSTVNISGRISPRAPAGASAADITAAFVSPALSGW